MIHRHPTLGIRMAPPPEIPDPPPPAWIEAWPGEPAVRFLLRNAIHVTVYPGMALARAGRLCWSARTLEELARKMGWVP